MVATATDGQHPLNNEEEEGEGEERKKQRRRRRKQEEKSRSRKEEMKEEKKHGEHYSEPKINNCRINLILGAVFTMGLSLSDSWGKSVCVCVCVCVFRQRGV